jgi:hypothetical protein
MSLDPVSMRNNNPGENTVFVPQEVRGIPKWNALTALRDVDAKRLLGFA